MAPNPDKKVSLFHWLMVGGMGPPPTAENLLRMSSERKASYREEKWYDKEREKERAEFERRWGPTGFAGLASKLLGTNKRKKPRMGEVMKTYGPGGFRRDMMASADAESSGSAGRDDDDDDDNDEPGACGEAQANINDNRAGDGDHTAGDTSNDDGNTAHDAATTARI